MVREGFERADEPLVRLELCAARHTPLDMGEEWFNAETLLAVNEEVEFLGGQMTVIHDSLRRVVRAGVGVGFRVSKAKGQSPQATGIATLWLVACGLWLVASLFLFIIPFSPERFTQLVPCSVDVGLNGS